MLKLEHYRRQKGMSIRQLSFATGISRTYLTGIEEGFFDNPSINVVCAICKAFNITPNELICEEMYK